MSADTAMFGDYIGVVGWRMDRYSFPNDWITYYPSDVQWEVACQMNADFVRLRNQEGTIVQLQSDLAASRAECERLLDQLSDARIKVELLRPDAERYRWLREHAYKLIGADRGMGPEFPYGDELDAEIDQSRQALEPK